MNGDGGKKTEMGLTQWVHLIVSEERDGWIKMKVCVYRVCLCVFMTFSGYRYRRKRLSYITSNNHILVTQG